MPAPSIWRATSADHVNKILNDPEVRPWVAEPGDTPIDVSAQVANSNNHLLCGRYGACMFFHIMPGIYEVHSQCLPAGRGQWMLAFSDEALKWMFTRTDCAEVVTRVPVGHAGARALTLANGFTKEFTRPQECSFRGKMCDLDVYRLSIHDWVEKSAWAERVGRTFHSQLHAEARRLGVKDMPHGDDPQHNRIVGVTAELARHEQVVKAVLFYCRWAFIARHAPIALVSQDPPAVKMDIGILKILPHGIEVSPCK